MRGLPALLLEWEWVAAGHDSGHIGREVNEELKLLDGVENQDLHAHNRSDRWFFTDYGIEFGAVPDEWVQALIEKRDALKDAVKEEDDGNGGRKTVPDEEKRASWQIVAADMNLQVEAAGAGSEGNGTNVQNNIEEVVKKFENDIKEVVEKADEFVRDVYGEFVFGEYDRETVTMATGGVED